MKVGREVERWQSPDDRHVLRFFRRDAHFYFVELSETAKKGETFWGITRTSEEYGSLEKAREAALRQLPWLRETVKADASGAKSTGNS